MKEYEVAPYFFDDYAPDLADESEDSVLLDVKVVFDTEFNIATKSLVEPFRVVSPLYSFLGTLDEWIDYYIYDYIDDVEERKRLRAERLARSKQNPKVVATNYTFDQPSFNEGFYNKPQELKKLHEKYEIYIEEATRRLAGFDEAQWGAIAPVYRRALVTAFEEMIFTVLPADPLEVLPLGKTFKLAKSEFKALETAIDKFEELSRRYKVGDEVEKEIARRIDILVAELRKHYSDLKKQCGSGCQARGRFYYDNFTDRVVTFGDHLVFKPMQKVKQFFEDFFDFIDIGVYHDIDATPDFSKIYRIRDDGSKVLLSQTEIKKYVRADVVIKRSTSTDRGVARGHDRAAAYKKILNNHPDIVQEVKEYFANKGQVKTKLDDDDLVQYFKGFAGHHGPVIDESQNLIRFQFVSEPLHKLFGHTGSVTKH